MKIELFVSSSFAPCRDAERIWRDAVRECNVDFAVLDVNCDNGQARAEQLGIHLVPALAVDGKLYAVGVQSPEEVKSLLASTCTT